MYDHIGFSVADLARSRAFYVAALAPLGYGPVMDVTREQTGGPETAHQIINTGDAELKYLAISTLVYPEICDYPDSRKFLVSEGQRDADGKVRGFRHIGRSESNLDYWDGE